jgi:uncharacterized membrane protein
MENFNETKALFLLKVKYTNKNAYDKALMAKDMNELMQIIKEEDGEATKQQPKPAAKQTSGNKSSSKT